MEPTVANFRSSTGVVAALAPKTRWRPHGFNHTRITFNRHLCRPGRRGIGEILSSPVHPHEMSESACFVRSALREEWPDQHSDNVRRVAQLPGTSSLTSRRSFTAANKDDSIGTLGRTIETALQIYFNEVREGCERILKDPNPAGALGNVLRQEFNMVYLMMCNDVSSAMLTYWCIGANLLAASPFLQTGDFHHFLIQAATTMSKEVGYSFLYLYSFNLANQYNGVAGDAIDKPWRPIPAGLVTEEGALARCVLVNLLYSFVSWHLGVLHWTLIWQAITASQFLGYEKDNSTGLGRSVAMFVGTVVQCCAGVSLATPMTPTLLAWAITRGALSGNHHWMQDFRDVAGDQRVGRTTIPLLFGVDAARKLMAFIFLMDPFYLHFVVMRGSNYTTPQLILEGLGAVLCATLAFRVMTRTTPAEDHETYTYWLTTYWHNWTFLLVGPAFLIGLDHHF